MPKELQAVVTATMWVECSDETEAQSIVEAIYDYEVPTHAGDAYRFGDVEVG